jgi:hypothetical protein
LFGDPGDFAPGGIQLGLKIGGRAGLGPGRRLVPGVGGGKTLALGIEPVGQQAQFPGDHWSGQTAVEPVPNGFAFEGFIEFTANFDRVGIHGFSFIVHPILCPSIRSNLTARNGKQGEFTSTWNAPLALSLNTLLIYRKNLCRPFFA